MFKKELDTDPYLDKLAEFDPDLYHLLLLQFLKDPETKEAIIWHQTTPVDILRLIAEEKPNNNEIPNNNINYILEHPNCPPDLIEEKLKEGNKYDFLAISKNCSITEEQIRELAKCSYREVLSEIGSRPDCPPDVLEDLFQIYENYSSHVNFGNGTREKVKYNFTTIKLFETLDAIKKHGYRAFFSSVFNIESGVAFVSEDMKPFCEKCLSSFSTACDCIDCGRTSTNYVQFKSGEGDGIYALWDLCIPGGEVLGALLLFDSKLVEYHIDSITEENSQIFDLDPSNVSLENLDGMCIGKIFLNRLGNEGNHYFFIGDSSADLSGKFALPRFYAEPGEYSVFLFENCKAALIIPTDRFNDFGINDIYSLDPVSIKKFVFGSETEFLRKHIEPAGLAAIEINVGIRDLSIVRETELDVIPNQEDDFITWLYQLHRLAPEKVPYEYKDFMKETFKEIESENNLQEVFRLRGCQLGPSEIQNFRDTVEIDYLSDKSRIITSDDEDEYEFEELVESFVIKNLRNEANNYFEVGNELLFKIASNPNTPQYVFKKMLNMVLNLEFKGKDLLGKKLLQNPSVLEEDKVFLSLSGIENNENSSNFAPSNIKDLGLPTSIAYRNCNLPLEFKVALANIGHPLSLLEPDLNIVDQVFDFNEIIDEWIKHETIYRTLWPELDEREDVSFACSRSSGTHYYFVCNGVKFEHDLQSDLPSYHSMSHPFIDRPWVEVLEIMDIDNSIQSFSHLYDEISKPIIYKSFEDDFVMASIISKNVWSKEYDLREYTLTDRGEDFICYAAELRFDTSGFRKVEIHKDLALPYSWRALPMEKKEKITSIILDGYNSKVDTIFQYAEHFLVCIALNPYTPESIKDKLKEVDSEILTQALAVS